MKLLALLLLVVNLHALSPQQLYIQQLVFERGAALDLSYTLTAIAEKESRYGKYTLNLSDPSCGIMHIMPKSLVKRTELEDTKWNHSRLCERLLIDNDFSLSAAILELKYWENYWKSKGVPRVWSHTVASYNGGFRATLDSPYLRDIKVIIKRLKKERTYVSYSTRNKK